MNFKKIFGLLSVSALLLTACGSDDTESNQDNENQDEASEVSEGSNTEIDSSSEEETDETALALYEINPNTFQVVPLEGSDAPANVVLFTFDDAPAPDGYALDIANTLESMDVNAIFFVNGMYLEDPEYAAVLKDIHDRGFEIGNHTYYHPDLTTYNYEQQRQEIVGTSDKIEEITGERPRFMRPPFGLYNETTLQIVAEDNMQLMNWSYGYDWEVQYQEPSALADIMVNTPYLGNGANLLMHDRSWTAAAVEDIVSGIQSKGYEIVDPKVIVSSGASSENGGEF